MTDPLPSLTVADVRAWANDRFFERGERYAGEGHIANLRRQGATLMADCRGSQPNPYHVAVTLDDNGIASARCTCPVTAPSCKHAVALLLTWLTASEDPPRVDTVEELLKKQSADDLVGLVLTMIRRHPDLETLARLSLRPASALDTADIRRRLREVFDRLARASRYPSRLDGAFVDETRPFLDLAERMLKADRLGDAAQVLRIFLDEAARAFSRIHGPSSHLLLTVNGIVGTIGEILGRTEDRDLRALLLKALVDLVLTDLDMGGVGLSEAARTVVLDHARSGERAPLAERVRTALDAMHQDATPNEKELTQADDKAQPISIGASKSFERQAVGGFLLDLIGNSLDDEDYLRICRQSDRDADRIHRLLSLGRTAEALGVIRRRTDTEITRLAPVFEEHNAADALARVVDQRIETSAHFLLVKWRRDAARESGDLETALALSRRLFWDGAPRMSEYSAIRDLARELGRWDAVQSKIHQRLRNEDKVASLAQAHLVDGNVGAAVDLLPEIRKNTPSSEWHLRLSIAKDAHKEYPETAIEIYEQYAAYLVSCGGRENYKCAAREINRAKTIHARLHDEEEWPARLQRFVNEHLSRRPAARDEFRNAGLL
jgi:hypothetical protein